MDDLPLAANENTALSETWTKDEDGSIAATASVSFQVVGYGPTQAVLLLLELDNAVPTQALMSTDFARQLGQSLIEAADNVEGHNAAQPRLI